MAVPRSLQLPGPEYSEQEERQFRRELEDYLLKISSDLEGAETRLGTVSSQATKRSLLSMIPVGRSDGGSSLGGGSVTSVDGAGTTDNTTVTGGPITTSGTLTVDLVSTGVSAGAYKSTDLTVDVKGRITAASDGSTGYYFGNQEISYTTFVPNSGQFPSTLTYYELPDFGGTGGYLNEVAQDFAEDGYTGDIKYTGTRPAKFLVQYGASLRCQAVLSHFYIYLRIAKTGSAVSGSDIRDNYYGDKVVGFVWARDTRLSGSAIVELVTDDTISIEIGIDAVTAGDPAANFGTGADGVSLCITEVSY